MIVALEEAKYKLTGMRPVVAELGNALRIDEQKVKIEELEALTPVDILKRAGASCDIISVSKEFSLFKWNIN